jgi:hypothetical protein
MFEQPLLASFANVSADIPFTPCRRDACAPFITNCITGGLDLESHFCLNEQHIVVASERLKGGRQMKPKSAISILPQLLPLVTACSGAQTRTALERVKAYEAAHNAYDVEGTLALFAEHAVIEFVDQATLPNLAAIRSIHEYDKGIRAQLTFQSCTVEGLAVKCKVVEQNDWLTTAGLGEIFYPSSAFTFTESGQIQKISATLSPQDGAAMFMDSNMKPVALSRKWRK